MNFVSKVFLLLYFDLLLSMFQHLIFSLVRSPARRRTPPLRRISVSDLMQTYSTVLDLHHIKTPGKGLFLYEDAVNIRLSGK